MGGKQTTPTRTPGSGYPVQPHVLYDELHLPSGGSSSTGDEPRYIPVPPGAPIFSDSSTGYSTVLQDASSEGERGNVRNAANSSSRSSEPDSLLERLRGMHARYVAARAFREAVVSGDLQRSLPHLPILQFRDFKCPVCSKMIPSDSVETHLVVCLTKPRITYNEDVLTENKGECVICLDDLEQGQTIARLPCLCIYHKDCIDSWFERNRSCPEHPAD